MYVDDSGLEMTLHSACLWKKGFRIPVWPQLTVQFEVSIRLVKHLGWDSHVAGITHVGYRGRELILSICCFCTCMCNEMKETHRNSEQVLYITFFQSFTGTWEAHYNRRVNPCRWIWSCHCLSWFERSSWAVSSTSNTISTFLDMCVSTKETGYKTERLKIGVPWHTYLNLFYPLNFGTLTVRQLVKRSNNATLGHHSWGKTGEPFRHWCPSTLGSIAMYRPSGLTMLAIFDKIWYSPSACL